MIRKLIVASFALAALGLTSARSEAHSGFFVRVQLGAHGYRPAYHAPAYRPYCAPAYASAYHAPYYRPVYVAPRPVYYRSERYHAGRAYRRHHTHRYDYCASW